MQRSTPIAAGKAVTKSATTAAWRRLPTGVGTTRAACRRSFIGAALVGAVLMTGCQAPAPVADGVVVAPTIGEVRRVLAPTGELRIAVYAGSPTSLVRRPGSDEVRGVSVDIGRALAGRLGVPARLVELERVEQVVDAVSRGQADMTITNATAARAARVDFTEPLLALELGFLAMPGSPVEVLSDTDRAGVRIGVSQGSSSQAALGAALRAASLVPAASLKEAAEMLKDGRIDAFATNKGILNQLADGLPGARILDGRWGTESLAIAVPKGREAGRVWLAGFAAAVRADGQVQRAADRAGLRGLAEPEAP